MHRRLWRRLVENVRRRFREDVVGGVSMGLSEAEKELLLSSLEHGIISVSVDRLRRDKETERAVSSLVDKGLMRILPGMSSSAVYRYGLTGRGRRVLMQLVGSMREAYVFLKEPGVPLDSPESPLAKYKPGEEIPSDLLRKTEVKGIRTEDGYIAVLRDGGVYIHIWNDVRGQWDIVFLSPSDVKVLKRLLS